MNSYSWVCSHDCVSPLLYFMSYISLSQLMYILSLLNSHHFKLYGEQIRLLELWAITQLPGGSTPQGVVIRCLWSIFLLSEGMFQGAGFHQDMVSEMAESVEKENSPNRVGIVWIGRCVFREWVKWRKRLN